MKKFLKFLIIIVIIAAVGAGAWFYVVPLFVKDGSGSVSAAYVMQVGSMYGDMSFLSNRYSAVVESQEVINVEADAEKKIKEVFVKEGDEVKAGDKLFCYDAEEMSLELEQAKLDKEQAQSEIKSYNDQIETLEKEYKSATTDGKKLSLENQLESTRLDLKKAEYTLESKEKRITQLENSIKNAEVKSSVSGVVRTVDDPTASAYITITSAGDLRIKASVAEDHIMEFVVGDLVLVRSRTDESVVWHGMVTSIETAKAQTSVSDYGLEKPSKYPVYIALESSEGLLIGQHVTVEADIGFNDPTTAEQAEGVWVDESFICDRDSSPYVWAEQDGALVKKNVTIGKYDEELFRCDVTSGITENDYIAFPEERLAEGMKTTHEFEMTEEMNNMEDMGGYADEEYMGEYDDMAGIEGMDGMEVTQAVPMG